VLLGMRQRTARPGKVYQLIRVRVDVSVRVRVIYKPNPLHRWYIYGATLGDAESKSVSREIHPNFERACKLLKSSAVQGHLDAEAYLKELDVDKYRIQVLLYSSRVHGA